MDDFNPMENMVDKTGEFDQRDINENKVMAVLTYLGWLWLIPLFARKESPFVKFHLNQAVILFVASIVLSIARFLITKLPLGNALYWILTVIVGIFSILGIYNAATGKAKELPIIGSLFTVIK